MKAIQGINNSQGKRHMEALKHMQNTLQLWHELTIQHPIAQCPRAEKPIIPTPASRVEKPIVDTPVQRVHAPVPVPTPPLIEAQDCLVVVLPPIIVTSPSTAPLNDPPKLFHHVSSNVKLCECHKATALHNWLFINANNKPKLY